MRWRRSGSRGRRALAETLSELASTLRERTERRVLEVIADVGASDAAERIVGRAVDEFGRVDILFNNAGINRRGTSADFTEEDWDAVVDVNLKGAFRLAQSCGRHMIARGGGSIVNILSLASRMGLPGAPAYSASKGGLALLTRTLAVEWALDGVRVNGIAPGFIRTSLNQAIQDDHRSDWVVRRTPMRRWGETHELTGAALFLASPASSFVTGQMLYVDGGFTAGSDWRTGD